MIDQQLERRAAELRGLLDAGALRGAGPAIREHGAFTSTERAAPNAARWWPRVAGQAP